jgi:hypothetical protein
VKTRHQFWHWPDHIIRKRESRRLRDEHNAAVNDAEELLQVLEHAEHLLSGTDAYYYVIDPATCEVGLGQMLKDAITKAKNSES